MSQQRQAELQQQVALLHVAAAAKGIDLELILTSAASTQQLLAAAAATASKGIELQTILSAAAAQQQLVAATAQQHPLVTAAAAAAATGTGADPPPHTPSNSSGHALPALQQEPDPAMAAWEREEGERGIRHSEEA